jgi:hypothetical protein
LHAAADQKYCRILSACIVHGRARSIAGAERAPMGG